ncbi:MAG: isoprenylcysteine carboxylmethyltransferase family protein [Candidatus Heimdallarchaeota archaeon]|nr:isoprenylcysteine carboxylmethyltransferase family protein [Candidatus Heimdallarchaeota archaeon]
MMSKISLTNIFVKFVFLMIIYALLLFIPVGTFLWFDAWICLLIASFGFGFQIFWFRNSPVLQSRVATQLSVQKWDKILYLSLFATIFATLVVAGLDYRINQPNVPFLIKTGDLIVLCFAFVLFFLVLRENAYLSKIVIVSENQKVCETGPYSFIRHPHYLAVTLIMLSLPFSLGTSLALIPGILTMILLMIRIEFEEKTLNEELLDYSDYLKNVRYRLFPKIW